MIVVGVIAPPNRLAQVEHGILIVDIVDLLVLEVALVAHTFDLGA